MKSNHLMTASIKLLNISLVLLCILTTAFVCMYLAITSSNNALDDTKTSRDVSVAAAFDVGEQSVMNRTREYLDTVLGGTVEFLGEFAKAHRVASMTLAMEVEAADWDDVRDFYWHRIPRYFYTFDLLRPDGNSAINLILRNNVAIIQHEDTRTLTNPPDGYHSKLVTVNLGNDYPEGGYTWTYTASSDSKGYPINVTDIYNDVNWDASGAKCIKRAIATNGSEPDEPCYDYWYDPPVSHPSYTLGRQYAKKGGTIWTPPLGIDIHVGITCISSILHGGRFSGVVASVADVRHISKHLSSLKIGGPVGGYPSRGRVFVTLRTTQMESLANGNEMIAASHGETTYEINGELYPMYPHESDDDIISSVASMVNATSEPSMEDLLDSGSEAVLVLNTSYAPEGEDFFYRIGRLSDSYGVDWYVHVVIDRAYILGSIDQKVAETRDGIKASEKHVEDGLRRARIVLYIAVVAVAVGLMALSTWLVFRIIGPLVVLEREMAAVAVMRLEDVNTERALSSLKEVRLMQKSFRKMIRNLVEYRNYMPASVLHDANQDSDSSADTATHSKSSVPESSGNLSSHRSAAGTQHTVGILQNFGTDIHSKRVTLMVCNIVGFLTTDDVQQQLAVYLSVGLHHLKMAKGIPDNFSGDRLYASWNGVRPCASHRFAAYHCAKDICADKGLGARLSIGLASGDVKCGNMGCDGMKRFSYIGSLSSWVHVVERIGRSMECEVAIDAVVNEEVGNLAYTRMLQHILYRKRSDQVLIVYEALGLRDRVRHEEWMYQLEEGQANDPHKSYNRSYELFMDKMVTEAVSLLGDADDGSYVMMTYKKRLRAAMQDPSICRPLGGDGPFAVV